MLFSKISKVFRQKFDNEKNVPISSLKETVNRTLKKNPPFKKKYVKVYQIPFINKTFSKEIMKRSHLRNKFSIAISEIDR